MKTLVLAEKPSVGRELARVLGCTNKQKGFSEGKQYIVTWAMGHLVELAGPEVYDQKYKTWSLETLPIIPEKMRHKVIGRTSKQFTTIKKLFARNDTSALVIATDAGREGELVARWIMRLGTPATRADIIEKIISNYYVVRQGKELSPTSRGLELLDLVPEKLKSPKLTADWELRLARIAEGEEKRELFLKDIRDETKKTVHQVKTSTARYTPKGTTEKKCPLCGKPLYPVKGKRGRTMLVCQGLSCGYEEQEGGGMDGKPSEKEKRIARTLMKQYGDTSKETSTFADLIKAAQERKNG